MIQMASSTDVGKVHSFSAEMLRRVGEGADSFAIHPKTFEIYKASNNDSKERVYRLQKLDPTGSKIISTKSVGFEPTSIDIDPVYPHNVYVGYYASGGRCYFAVFSSELERLHVSKRVRDENDSDLSIRGIYFRGNDVFLSTVCRTDSTLDYSCVFVTDRTGDKFRIVADSHREICIYENELILYEKDYEDESQGNLFIPFKQDFVFDHAIESGFVMTATEDKLFMLKNNFNLYIGQKGDYEIIPCSNKKSSCGNKKLVVHPKTGCLWLLDSNGNIYVFNN